MDDAILNGYRCHAIRKSDYSFKLFIKKAMYKFIAMWGG